MTTETTQPQPEMGPSPANGPGQTQGHRRRRRRRKNKSSRPGAAPVQTAQTQPGGLPPQVPPQQAQPAQTQAPPPQPQQAQPPRQQYHQQQGPPRQNQGRKKKKFFQKGSAPQPQAQPGNSLSGPPQNRRKQKQRGPREFVGPMDHSYRIANGNVADGPASTIQITSNGHGSYNPEAYQPPAAPAAIRLDAPTRIFCFIEDLFFQAKIQETAKKLGIKVEFVKGADKEVVARVTDMPEAERPRLLVFDLNNAGVKPFTLIPKFKTKLKKTISIIGFLNHLQGELKIKATEAGCDTVMPRSAFSQTLPNLLRRYGLEEEEEYEAQPM